MTEEEYLQKFEEVYRKLVEAKPSSANVIPGLVTKFSQEAGIYQEDRFYDERGDVVFANLMRLLWLKGNGASASDIERLLPQLATKAWEFYQEIH